MQKIVVTNLVFYFEQSCVRIQLNSVTFVYLVNLILLLPLLKLNIVYRCLFTTFHRIDKCIQLKNLRK